MVADPTINHAPHRTRETCNGGRSWVCLVLLALLLGLPLSDLSQRLVGNGHGRVFSRLAWNGSFPRAITVASVPVSHFSSYAAACFQLRPNWPYISRLNTLVSELVLVCHRYRRGVDEKLLGVWGRTRWFQWDQCPEEEIAIGSSLRLARQLTYVLSVTFQV